jgi:hypothetical protein
MSLGGHMNKIQETHKYYSDILKSAFDILDKFAEPSLNPDMFEQYEKIKHELKTVYIHGYPENNGAKP